MAGGIFTAFDKVRPGAYINTVSDKPVDNTNGRGVVLLMNGISYGWGKNGIVKLTSGSDFKKELGVALDDAKALTIRLALQGASVVKLINFNGGNVASADDKSVPYKITAKYAGVKGNDITVDFVQNIVNDKQIIVKTIFGTEVVDTQLVNADAPETIHDNDFVSFEYGNGSLAINGEKTVKLAGGTSQDVSSKVDVLSDALSRAVTSEQYTVVTTAGIATGTPLHKLLAQMVIDIRDHEGYKVTAVVPQEDKFFDNEAVTAVANGVAFADGSVFDNTTMSAWFAGQSASVSLNRSLTYVEVPGATGVVPEQSNQSIINALKAGNVVFTARKNGTVVVEQDINTLTTFTDTKSAQFRKNRELRALDAIANHVEEMFEDNFIGSVTNNDSGRSLLKASVIDYFKELQNTNVIGGYSADDIEITKGNADDVVIMNYAITPVDSMEKLYNTIKVTR